MHFPAESAAGSERREPALQGAAAGNQGERSTHARTHRENETSNVHGNTALLTRVYSKTFERRLSICIILGRVGAG